jgi:cell division protein FtsL
MNDLKRSASASIRKVVTQGQARAVFFAALVAVLFAAVGIFHTASRVAVVRAGYELGQVEREYRELLREREHLRMEKATLRSAPRLEAFARARLGMSAPAAGQLISMHGPARPTQDRTLAQVTLASDTRTP